MKYAYSIGLCLVQRFSATVDSQRVISPTIYDDLTSANREQELLTTTTRPNLKVISNVLTPAPSYQLFTVGTLVSFTLRISLYWFMNIREQEQHVNSVSDIVLFGFIEQTR